MRQLPVSFFDLAVCLEDRDRKEYAYYLDTQTGEIIELNQMLYQELENREDLSPDDPDDWQPKELDEMIRVLQDREGRYKAIPVIKAGVQLDMMRAFMHTIPEDAIVSELQAALHDHKAAKKFQQVLNHHQKYQGAYDRFIEDEQRKFLEQWLASVGIDPQWQ